MASSSQQKMIHQDYMARIRYSNALPPPPNPPKLLDIPNTGLASGQYTTPVFASRLARDQPLNIEADAELGMPLDLVGMPGIFDGDESSIQAPIQQPPIHARDRALLRPVQSLGKPKLNDSGVSFLRRTEYISSYTSKSRFDSTTSKDLVKTTGIRKKKAADGVDKESPEYIGNQVEKSFVAAKRQLESGSLMRHPSKKNVKLVDSFALLPDKECFPDTGGYVTVKFMSNPVPPSSTYDIRLENSVLRPSEPDPEVERMRDEQRELHERDPKRNPPPDNTIEYDYFFPETLSDAMKFKRKFDPDDSENESEDLYPQKSQSGEGIFRFKHLRAYETATIIQPDNRFGDEVFITVNDGQDGKHQKGAFYYPVVQKIQIRPQRDKNINTKRNRFTNSQQNPDDLKTDFLDIRVHEPDEIMRAERDSYIDNPFPVAEEDIVETVEADDED